MIPGEQQPMEVHLAAIAINEALGNIGKTVIYTETVNPLPSQQNADFKSLVADLNAGKVDWLVILNANPIYAAPADLDFADAFNKANIVVAPRLALRRDRRRSPHWHIPAAHYLESWSDARAYDGTVSIVQPMIDPLYGGNTAHHVFQALLNEPMVSPYDAVRETWKPRHQGRLRDRLAQGAARRLDCGHGVCEREGGYRARRGRCNVPAPTPKNSIEIIFRPDPNIYDGRWNNVGWLQELPKPVTNLSWDNAAIVSGRDAHQAKAGKKTTSSRSPSATASVKAPVIVAPGHPDNSVTVYLGYGRRGAGRVGSGRVSMPISSATRGRRSIATGSIRKAGRQMGHRRSPRATTRITAARPSGGKGNGNNSLEADEALGPRGIIRYATLDEFKANPGLRPRGRGPRRPRGRRDVDVSQLDVLR